MSTPNGSDIAACKSKGYMELTFAASEDRQQPASHYW